MNHLLDPTSHYLSTWLANQELPTYRAGQIHQWLFNNRVSSFDEMTNLPAPLRNQLNTSFDIWTTTVVQRLHAEDGTEKLLLQLRDGGHIECVLLRDGFRRTICISSQVGCAMGCVFCASGLDGVERNLTAGEIVEQMLLLQRLLPTDERLSHIVVMGMGEPLANIDQLLPALEQATAVNGLAISARRITISTVGLPTAIDRLTTQCPRFHLAVSLHAPNDELRDELVPVNKNIGLDRILAAADRYFEASGRRLTFEYVLLAGINDQPQHGHQLARRLRGRPALVNLIPYNPVAGLIYRTPTSTSVQRFRDELEKVGLTVQIRQRKGSTIYAACGQLRRATPTIRPLPDGTL